jgi:hypothetical protein
MSKNPMYLIEEWQRLQAEEDVEALKGAFIELLPADIPAEDIFADIEDSFAEEELAEVAAELAYTILADCSRDDFHNWDYDHMEFIIEQSNKHDFEIPRNFLNGLPEQLIILVNSGKVNKPEC